MPGKAGKTFKIFNPATGEHICDIHEALQEDVDLAVQFAANAFPAWSERNAFERAIPLAKLAQLVLRDGEELAGLDALAMGKYVFTSLAGNSRALRSLANWVPVRPVELSKKMDIPGCSSIINYYAGAAYHVLGESSLNTADFLNVSVRQPYGVVGLIIPWNVGATSHVLVSTIMTKLR